MALFNSGSENLYPHLSTGSKPKEDDPQIIATPGQLLFNEAETMSSERELINKQ